MVFKGQSKGSEALFEEYTYGVNGFRTSKTSDESGSAVTTRYVYLGNNVIYETGTSTKKLIWDNTRQVAEVVDGTVTYNHPDHLGSTSVQTNASGQTLSFVGTKPYGTFISGYETATRWEEFTDTGNVDGAHTTAPVQSTEGTAISGYTTNTSNDILYSVNTQSINLTTSYVEVKSYNFTMVKDDYKREFKIDADICGLLTATGYLKVELVKPDDSREEPSMP